jgi:hypothetical protein
MPLLLSCTLYGYVKVAYVELWFSKRLHVVIYKNEPNSSTELQLALLTNKSHLEISEKFNAVLRSLQEKKRNGEKHNRKGWPVKLCNSKIGG